MTDKIVLFSTCDSADEARRIAHHLVESRLAACVNIVPGLTSVYRWQGEVEEAAEWLLVIKSSRPHFERLAAELARVHNYQVPELVALPVIDGAQPYLDWLERELDLPSAPDS